MPKLLYTTHSLIAQKAYIMPKMRNIYMYFYMAIHYGVQDHGIYYIFTLINLMSQSESSIVFLIYKRKGYI